MIVLGAPHSCQCLVLLATSLYNQNMQMSFFSITVMKLHVFPRERA